MRTKSAVVVAVGAALAAACAAQEAGRVSREDAGKIWAAMPDKPVVKPVRERRLLVFSVCTSFWHPSIPYAKMTFEMMGRRTGAFTAVVSDDLSMFEPDKLKGFDAVLMNNTTGELFLPKGKKLQDLSGQDRAKAKRLRKSLLDFVNNGGGLVGVHAATDCSYRWKEYGEMIGGYFAGHPWNASSTVVLKIDDPDHPINAAFGGKPFKVTDEIYQFREPYSRSKLRVLLSLDTEKTDMNKKGIRRKDGDFAVSWVRPYGKGRVFYCSLGHRKEIFQTPVLLKHYLAGVQFALGDLKAEAAPRPITAPAQAAAEGWETLFDGKDLAQWDYRPGGWVIEDGAICRNPKAGFIWSKKQYKDFILDLEFKVAKGTNSGIFIRTASRRNWLHSGIEVQVLDSHGKDKPSRHDCGAIYDCLAPSKNTMKPAGEWNRIVITCSGSDISVVLNGEQIIDMDLGKWTEAHKNPDATKNKFDRPYKEMTHSGYIGFQDHGHPVWFRNVRIRELGE